MKELLLSSLVSLSVLIVASCQTRQNESGTTGIFGQEDRVYTEEWPQIGLLEMTGVGVCTATIVDTNVIATAAHCVVSGVPLKFHANFKSATLAGKTATVTDVIHNAGGHGSTYATAHLDWALLRIDADLGADFGILPMLNLRDRTLPISVQLIGYPDDLRVNGIPKKTSNNAPCHIRTLDNNGLMLHDCDAWGGNSGGPLLLTEGNTTFVVGFHAGGRRKTFETWTEDDSNRAASAASVLETLKSGGNP